MIIVKNINGTPEELPNKHFGVHSDNENFYFFESNEEFKEFLKKLSNKWDVDSYKEQINEAHNQLFEQLYTEKDYLNTGEISLWLNDKEFKEEAQSLITWWTSTCKEVEEYLNNVTEETALPIQDFINNLQKL